MPTPPDLPDDIDALKALLLNAQARIGELEDAVVSHAAADARRAAEIEYLKVTIAKLKKLAFGRKSEKYDTQLEQLELRLDECIADEAATPAGMRGETAHTRRPATRNPLPDHLLREDNVLQPQHEACAECGSKMTYLDEDVSEQLEYVPSSFKVIRHVRPKYACSCCDHIAQAPAAVRPIARGVSISAVISPKGDADKILDYFGGSPCIHMKTASEQSSCNLFFAEPLLRAQSPDYVIGL